MENLQEKMTVDTGNSYYYLANGAMEVFQKAHDISTTNDTFLVFWPYQMMFAAISGRREYFANQFFTIDFQHKNDQSYQFISNQMSPEKMAAFLHDGHISYVIMYPNALHVPTPFLTQVYTNGYLVIDKVQ